MAKICRFPVLSNLGSYEVATRVGRGQEGGGRQGSVKKKPRRVGANDASVAEKRKLSGAAQQARLKADYKAFRSLEAQREVVERAKRAVFHHLMGIVLGNIDLATEGNEAALKAVLAFAGIDDLAPLTGCTPHMPKEGICGLPGQQKAVVGHPRACVGHATPLNEAELEQVEQAPAAGEPKALRDPVEAFGKRLGMEISCQ